MPVEEMWHEERSVASLYEILAPPEWNPKLHAPEIASSLQDYGYLDTIVVGRVAGTETEYVVSGNGRVKHLYTMMLNGATPPKGVVVRDGEWWIAVKVAVFPDEFLLRGYLYAANNLTLVSGFREDHFQVVEELYREILEKGASPLNPISLGLEWRQIYSLEQFAEVFSGEMPGWEEVQERIRELRTAGILPEEPPPPAKTVGEDLETAVERPRMVTFVFELPAQQAREVQRGIEGLMRRGKERSQNEIFYKAMVEYIDRRKQE